MPPVYFLVHLVGMIALHLLIPIAQWLDPPLTYAGALPVLAGLALAAVGALLFGRRGTTIKPFQESSELVVDGPFRFSRNPMYLGMLLVLVGTAMLLGSVSPLIALPSFLWLITTRFIAPEEAMLDARFGERYAEYRRRVRRWI